MKYRAILLLASIGGILLIGLALIQDSSRSIALPAVCGATLQTPSISWETFEDVEGGLRQKNDAVIQRASDIFSWQDFIALNWPASAERGLPAKDKPLHADGPRVWETWMAPSDVFLKNGGKPVWKPNPNPALKELHDTREPTVSDGVLPPSLKDQRGNAVYFEIRLNRVFFD